MDLTFDRQLTAEHGPDHQVEVRRPFEIADPEPGSAAHDVRADGVTPSDYTAPAVVGRRHLLRLTARNTLYDMKTSALTIRLDRALQRQLAQLAKRSGRSRSEIARDALRRQLAVLQFEDLRRQLMPFAEARGYLTDEDVFRDVS